MTNVLSIRNARKRFRTVQALDGADLEVRTGEVLALLGPNGAGKTTLIKAVAGRVRLDEGGVELLGRHSAKELGEARRRIGIVPQDIALYDLLTARENLEILGRFHELGSPLLQERIDWALEWTGLAPRAGDLVKGFSGGMKRRLNIACGVLHRPDLLLLDEPTVGVDPQSRERIWQMLAGLRRDGVSLLLTTHQLDEAEAQAERIVILDHGRTIASGTLQELIDRTLGSGRRITVLFDREPVPSPVGAERGADGRSWSVPLTDVRGDLDALVAQAEIAGCRVEEVRTERPDLHAVFLHLTGRELRE